MKCKTLWLLFLLFAGTQLAGAQARLVERVTRKGSELVIPYEKYVLPNGLTVILHEDKSDPLVHVDVTYHVGSAREEIGKSGFAHFFEHMMFQGSDNVADEQHFKIVTEAGGTLNGTTNRDRTNYFQTVPANQLEKMLWLEADRMGFLLDAVTQQKFEVQRATVKNERGQNYDNRPYGLAQEYLAKNLYPYGHPYSWLTIGYVEDLDRVDVNDLKNFFLRWYGPNNATLTIGGDFNTKEVLQLVQKYFGSIPRGPEVKNMPAMTPHVDRSRFVHYVDNYARFPLFLKAYATVPNYHKDMAALACLAQVLGQGNNSILYQQLVKPQLALQAGASSQLSELAGEFWFTVVPMPGKSPASSYAAFKRALDSFEVRGVTEEDITRFKGGIEAQLISGLQSVSGKVSQLAAFQTFTGNPNKIRDIITMYDRVTKEDVMRVYYTYVKNAHGVTLSVVPKGQEQQIVADDNHTISTANYKAPDYGYAGLKYVKAKDKFDRSKMPGNGPNPVVKVPAYWTENMANGVRLIGTTNTEVPTVTLIIQLPGGHLLQSQDKSKLGLADFFASMMNDDTELRTAEEMSRELQKLGSSISVYGGLEGFTVQVQCLKKNLDATMALLEERLLKPKFTDDAFKRMQRQRLEGFKQLKSQPEAIADLVFSRLNYGKEHILGVSDEGTEVTVKNLKPEDIREYYKNTLTSQGTRVVVVGDITEAEILPKLGFLNKLPNRKLEIPQPGPGVEVEKTRIYLVDVPKAAQTQFRVGYPTNLLYDATGEFFRAGLMNYNLGGAFNSRINLKLREDKGWTYGARSGFDGSKYGGTFEFSAGIKAEATDSALVELMNDLDAYVKDGITAEELTFMKSAIGQRDALRYETAFQKAGFIGRLLEYNLPASYVDQQNQIVQNLTAAEVNALARKWITTGKMNILLVGDKAKILPGLQKLGYEIVELDTDGNVKK
ncbi:MAG TPA: pitrilysin family protein [Lacibacter sp.]|nr:pitrilysin family protein [Lacibacter sp.]HMO90159.1 pitrilysin family protein [Lacibacter sp.]HMP85832.1 pitrilysin family protein [Lacibacter sp.]